MLANLGGASRKRSTAVTLANLVWLRHHGCKQPRPPKYAAGGCRDPLAHAHIGVLRWT